MGVFSFNSPSLYEHVVKDLRTNSCIMKGIDETLCGHNYNGKCTCACKNCTIYFVTVLYMYYTDLYGLFYCDIVNKVLGVNKTMTFLFIDLSMT